MRFDVKEPPKEMEVKSNQRLDLRFAKAEIYSIDSTGLMTIKITEPVELMNNGQSIDPDMMKLHFVQNSEETGLSMTWDLVKYNQTEI